MIFKWFSGIYPKIVEKKVIKLDIENFDDGSIKEAAELIDTGYLVAFPTETVYGIACRTKRDALHKLSHLKERSSEKYFTLHIAYPNEVERYVPQIQINVQKLIKNGWPGPLTIVFELEGRDLEKQRKNLEQDIFDSLYKNNSIGIRCPDHPVATSLLNQANHPVVASSANLAGDSPAVNGEQIVERFSDQIDMVLDAGPTKYGLNSTVVKMSKKQLEILRPGVWSEEYVRTLSKIRFLFVCTGNTCRSPMAEGLFKKYLAEKLEARIDEIETIGYTVESAGMIGSVGYPASPQAVVSCAAKGVDISAHKNKGLSRELIEESDYIFVMEPVHREKVEAMVPRAAEKCRLLDENGRIPDPIGHPQSFYDRCVDQIEKAVKKRMSELVI